MTARKPLLKARLINKYEVAEYEKLLDQLHYLGSCKVEMTKRLRYVVENEAGQWCALLDFGYAALKNTALDEHLGWEPAEKKKRLKYVLNNTRFLVLPWMKTRYKNLASQSLALVTKRLSSDWEYYHGHHILYLETFVDESKKGTCYKAANWLEVGTTRGYGKVGSKWIYHGNKKKVFVFALHKQAKQILSNKVFPHPILVTETRAMLNINEINLTDLESIFLDIPDHRPNPTHGNTFPASKLLLVAACAFLSGYTSYVGIGEYVKNLTPDAVAKFRFKKNLKLRPEETVIRKFINKLDPEQFYNRLYKWLEKNRFTKKIHHIAIDGKAMKACLGDNQRAVMNVSAVDANSGVVLSAKEVSIKSNEIPAVQELLDSIDIKNRLISADAMHLQVDTAKKILSKGGDYLFALKGNQHTLLCDVERLHEKTFSPCIQNRKQSTRQD